MMEHDTFGCAPQASWFAPLAFGATWPQRVEPPLWGHSGHESDFNARVRNNARVLIANGFPAGGAIAERERRARGE
jgi:hypothetical protein